jgi:hypothetical protein
LLTLARESGGQFFKTGNDVSSAVGSSVADGSAYYMLGYVPESQDWYGKFRKIQVR